MLIYNLFFYVFAFLLIVSSMVVITAKNPVHSVLWLIFAFFNAAGLFIMLNAEFIAMTLVIVYVGAVAVLFLFVVMMLDINLSRVKEGFRSNLPICILIAVVLFVDFIIMYSKSSDSREIINLSLPLTKFKNLSNSHALGSVLYTEFMPIFLTAGLILLVAMISAIALTHRRRENVRTQNAAKQYSREIKDCMEVVSVEIGKGVKE